MNFIITQIFFTCSLVLGVTIVTQNGMALYNIRLWAEKKENKIYEPLLLCEWCMPSIYGFIGFFLASIFYTAKLKYFLCYPAVIGGSSLICGSVWCVVKILIDKSKDIN